MPGIKPMKLPIKEHLNTNHLFDIKSLKPFNHPEDSSFAFSDIALFDLKSSTISGTAKIDIAMTIKWIPFPKYITTGFWTSKKLLKSNLYSDEPGEIPIAPIIKPKQAAINPLDILAPVNVPTIVIPKTASISISPVPKAKIIGFAICMIIVSKIAPNKPPNKEEKNAADKARAAWPFFANGKPSITVACADTDPGTPIKTAGNVSDVATTDNNPIIIAIPEIGSIPKTNGNKSDRPTVPPNPGITPTIRPIITPAIKKSIDGPETIVMNALSSASIILRYIFKIINWGVSSPI